MSDILSQDHLEKPWYLMPSSIVMIGATVLGVLLMIIEVTYNQAPEMRQLDMVIEESGTISGKPAAKIDAAKRFETDFLMSDPIK